MMKFEQALKYFREKKFEEPRWISVVYGVLLGVVVLCFIVVPLFVFQTVPVMMQSMKPTIHGGIEGTNVLEDCVGLSLLSGYGHGDIVVFDRRENGTTTRLIKRILGEPGDTLFLVDDDGDGRADAVEIETELNGAPRARYRLIESYLNDEYGHYVANDEVIEKRNASKYDTARALWSEAGLTLGENEYFVAGDNRRISSDSFTKIGTVDGNAILGKAVCIFTKTKHSFLFWRIYDAKGVGPGTVFQKTQS